MALRAKIGPQFRGQTKKQPCMYWSQNRPVISSCNVLTVGDTILDKLWICPQASDSIDGGGQLPTPAAHKPATAAYLTTVGKQNGGGQLPTPAALLQWVNRTEGDNFTMGKQNGGGQLPTPAAKKAPFINFEMNDIGIV